MKKPNQILWLATATVSISLGACTAGFEEESNFDSGVHNKQLESPSEATATKTVNSDGNDIFEVSWPVVYGAGGFKLSVDIYDDPENPVGYVKDTIINGSSFSYKISEDTKYLFKIQTMANSYWKKTDNKDALTASSFIFDSSVKAYTIPEGSDVAKYINDFFSEHDTLATADKEVAFELESGKSYTLDTLLNTTLASVIIRGDKVHHPLVTVGTKGGFSIYGGFKLKYLDFDCTNATSENGILNMGNESTLADPLKKKFSDDANGSYYHAESTILVQDCVFKSVPNGFLSDGGMAWCVKDFRIKDCFIELNPSDSKLGSTGYPFIDFDNGGITIKDITWTNSTIVNLKKSSAYFVRFSNGSNSAIQKAYGKSYTGKFTMDHCTLVRCTTGGQFGNNCWTSGSATTISWKYCIFYDCYLLQKLIRNLPVDFNNGNNTIWGITNTVDSSDATKYATEEDPIFEGGEISADVIDGYDFSLPNGGFALKPTNGIAAASQYGDSRWFE